MRRRIACASALGVVLWLDPRVAPPDPSIDAELPRVSIAVGSLPTAGVAAPGSAPHHDIPISGDGRHVIVDGTLNGTVSGPMLVDTGSSYCVLTHGTARRLGLRSPRAGSIPVATANGQVAADLVQLDAMRLEDADLAHVDAVVMDAVEPPLIGIVGLSYLSHFRMSVDFDQQTLRLER